MSVLFLELLSHTSGFPDSGIIAAANFPIQSTDFLDTSILSPFGTTITKQDAEYVEFNYFYFEKSKPNKLSGVL